MYHSHTVTTHLDHIYVLRKKWSHYAFFNDGQTPEISQWSSYYTEVKVLTPVVAARTRESLGSDPLVLSAHKQDLAYCVLMARSMSKCISP